MRIACKLMLLAGMAVTAMACTAVTASAQETQVEALNEATGEPCNPCSGHAVGESHIVAMPSGAIVSSCSDEVEGNVYSNGTGETEWIGSPHSAPGCNTINCSGAEAHWPVSGAGELGTGEGHATLRLCLSASGSQLHCDIERHLEDDLPGDHQILVSLDGVCAGGARRIEAFLQSESENHDAIEVVHLEAD